MAEWRRCLRRLPAQLRRAKKGTPAALKYKGRDENRALFICVPMIGGRHRSFASVDISSPLDAERQGEDLRRIVRVVVVRQAMTTLIDGKGFTDDAGRHSSRASKCPLSGVKWTSQLEGAKSAFVNQIGHRAGSQ